MAKIAYHAFKKPKINRAGKKFYRWYYYFTDLNGKKIQRACSGCKNRPDAESYIRTLAPPPGAQDAPDLSIKAIAENMYIPESDHVSRRRQLGKSIEMETLKNARFYIDLTSRELDALFKIENFPDYQFFCFFLLISWGLIPRPKG